MKDFIITVAGLLAIVWLAMQIFATVMTFQTLGYFAGLM